MSQSVDWRGIDTDPQFQELHRRKSRFLWALMIFSIIYYFLLPIGAGYFTDLFRIKLWGPVNFGIVFALSEFIVAWGIAYIYARVASRTFDPMAEVLVRKAGNTGGKR